MMFTELLYERASQYRIVIDELIQSIKKAFTHLGCTIEQEVLAPMTGTDIISTKYDEKYIAKAYSGKSNWYVEGISQLLRKTEINQKILVVPEIISDMKNRNQNVTILNTYHLENLKNYKIMPTKTLTFSLTDDFTNKITHELLSYWNDVIAESSVVKCVLKSSNNNGLIEIEEQGRFLYGKPSMDVHSSDWEEFRKKIPMSDLEKFDAEWSEEKRHVEIYSRDYQPSYHLPPRIRYLCNFIFGENLQNITATYYEIPDIRSIAFSQQL